KTWVARFHLTDGWHWPCSKEPQAAPVFSIQVGVRALVDRGPAPEGVTPIVLKLVDPSSFPTMPSSELPRATGFTAEGAATRASSTGGATVTGATEPGATLSL